MSVRESIVEERANNPCATLKQIADKHGVIKERVRQVLSETNLPTRHWRQSYICNNCAMEFYPRGGRSKRFCSPDCRKEYFTARVACDSCGRVYQTSYPQLIRGIIKEGQRYFYCSRSCKGRATGLNYGFHIHPENCFMYKPNQTSKWAEYIPRIRRLLEQGKELNPIMRELGIPRGSYLLIKKLVENNT
jgi:hypothetical protein